MTDDSVVQRVDKWLWHARFARTRSLAQKLVTGGKTRINRTKVSSSSHTVKPGDILTLTLPRQVRIVEIIAIADKRGPYQSAKLLYNDLTPAPAKVEKRDDPLPAGIEKEKRPDSRSRRLAIRMKQGSNGD